jgi:predicted phage tail protein
LVDRTPPDASVLASPINGFIVERAPGYSLSFFWYEPERDGVTYDLQVAADAQFTNVVLSKTKLPPASYGIPFGEIGTLVDGTYYWRVRAIDKAGNVGPWSEVGMFMVKTKVS